MNATDRPPQCGSSASSGAPSELTNPDRPPNSPTAD